MSREHWHSMALTHAFNTFRAMHGGVLPVDRLRAELFPRGDVSPESLESVTSMIEYLGHVASGDLAALCALEARIPRVMKVYPDTPVRLAHHLAHQDTGFDKDKKASLRATYEPIISHLLGGEMQG